MMIKYIQCIFLLSMAHAIYSFKITFMPCIPFSHFNALQKIALDLKKIHPEYDIEFIVIKPEQYSQELMYAELEQANIQIHNIVNKHSKYVTANLQDVEILLPTLASLTTDTNLIVFDTFTIAAGILGIYKNIPTVGIQLQSTAGNYDTKPSNQYQKLIRQIENTYSINIAKYLFKEHKLVPRLSCASPNFNIYHGYPLFIDPPVNTRMPLGKIYYGINTTPAYIDNNFEFPKINTNQNLIYVSFGSWSGNKKNHQKTIISFYDLLVKTFGEKEKYIFIFGNVRNKHELFSDIPSNFYVYETKVPQTAILAKADLFITQAGAISIKEGIMAEVPMLAFPLNTTDDQYNGAYRIETTQIGVNLRNRAYTLTPTHIENTISMMLSNQEFYKENIRKIKQVPPQNFAQIIEKIIQEL